jgi:ABC-type multidrug transport system ATPase subunit
MNSLGKTTTLKILTGDEVASSGAAYVGGDNMANTSLTTVRTRGTCFGYCPQFDALHDNLTARETLQFYGRIRGIPEERLNEMVEFLIGRLSLNKYADRPAGTYSGGNKRKLSVAIALIGNPPVVFLDGEMRDTQLNTMQRNNYSH